MKVEIIKIIKHFQPEDIDFYGDFYVTVEIDGRVLRTSFRSHTDEAEAYADGYADALNTMGYNAMIEVIDKADAEFETD